jgi:hypothetical protein
VTDEGNRTEKGLAPAPFGPEPEPQDDAATADTVAPVSLSQPAASRSLPAIDRGRYKIQGEVGRGGLGRILRARDEYLDRPVAVKELLAPDAGAQARFVREALITARLQHPAIVPIYDAGQSDDEGPFYAMKLVAGASLHEILAEKTTLEARLALLPSVIAVVDAMAYAHSEKIIHRDLKPQNVLVGKYGETVLIDWGLAKDLSEIDNTPYRASAAASSSTETLDGAVMGTPAFMPPEQAAGEEVDEKADVYALGAMLYFLIAGVPPHAGRNMDDMLLKIVSGDIVPVQEREPRCPADLAAIVGKAMQRERADRYPSAGELAEDLKKFQTGQLVGAHQYTLNERFRRWLRKHRGIVAVATIALAILIGYGVWSIARIRTQKARAIAAAARADANAAEANQQRDVVLAQSMLVRARQYAATGHTAEELAVLRALASRGAAAERMAIEDGGLIWKAHQRLAMALGDNVGLVHRTADGQRFVATVPGALVTWDVITGEELARMPVAGDVARFGRVLAISPMGRFAIVRECVPPLTTCGVDISPDGNVFVPSADTILNLVEVTTGRAWRAWRGPLDRRAIAFAADDAAFVKRRVSRLDIVEGETTHHEVDEPGCEGALAVGTAARFAIACKDKVVLHTEHGRTEILKGPAPTQLVFIGADRLLAIVGDKVKLWDVERGELRGEGALVQAAGQREEEEESDEMPWSYFAPGASKERGGEAMVPQIRVGHTTSIVARTSILSPPPRITSAGALLSLEGHDWQALVVQDDLVRYALVDQLVPAEPPDRCLSRVGSERHATLALDNGERLLVDQQELALGLAAAPPAGYRHTTTAEVPVRQLRPLVAAERATCLVWSAWSYGAHRIDGGIIPPLAGAATTADGGIVVVGTREAFRIDRDGKRTAITTASAPVISPSNLYVASADATTLTITSVATGQVVRSWTAPGGAPAVEWIGKDIVGAFGHVVTLDAAVVPRPRDARLATDPRSTIGVSADATEVRVEQLADGKQLARHAGPAIAAVPFPDTSGRVIVTRADNTREILAIDGTRVALAPLVAEILGYDVVVSGDTTLLVAHQRTRSDMWDLATGALVAIPATSNLVAVIDDAFWMIDGKSTLVRTKRDGSQRTERLLSTTGLTFHRIADEVVISDDRKRISARYALDDERFAYAIWSTDSGTLLWVGPTTASIVGDWLVAGGRATIPAFDLAAVLRDSGARTNLRVCEQDLRVVPVVPPPAPETYWAPPAACR